MFTYLLLYVVTDNISSKTEIILISAFIPSYCSVAVYHNSGP